jgi:acetyl esterase
MLTPSTIATDLPDARASASAAIAYLPPYESEHALTAHDRTVPGAGDQPDIAIRTYTRAGTEHPVPAVVFLHGGAFVQGDLAWGDGTCREIADRLGVLVVSVEHRAAPENPYPAGVEDAYTVLAWVAANADELSIDPARIAVMGESSGGGIAAAAAILAKERGGPAIAAQILDAPTVDDRFTTPSMHQFTDTPGWRSVDAPHSWGYYLTGTAKPGDDNVPLTAAPARATPEDLVGLPPAYVVAYGIDPTRDECINYARLLIEAGVPTDVRVHAGAFHLAHLFPGTTIGRRMLDDRLEAIGRLLSVA